MRNYKIMALPAVLLGLAGCNGTPANGLIPRSTYQLEVLTKTTPSGTAFARALTEDYRAFAQEERDEYDWYAQQHFAKKGLAAANGEVVQPEQIGDYDVGHGPVFADLTDARARLVAMLASDAPQRVPEAAARAQTQFDCWLHEQDEGWEIQEIAECRAGFMTAMNLTVAAPAPVAAAPQIVKPAPSVKVTSYSVFFDFDKSDLTADARQNIALAAEKIKAAGSGKVHITGYTDTVGTVAYNLKLSLRRADAVEKELAKDGIPVDRQSAEGRGKSDLLVATPDGVREPKNRRATIELQ